jgi:hypothetical protein
MEKEIQNVVTFRDGRSMINGSNLLFIDCSEEQYRIYEYSDGFKITINETLCYYSKESGSHRVFDGFGMSHYIAAGWKHLYWEVKKDKPNFTS